MKHTAQICKQCGSQTRGQIYNKELLDEDDIDRIRICNSCKSEYFLYDDLTNNEDLRLVDSLFAKVCRRIGIDEEQGVSIAKRMFINQLKIR